MSDIEHFNKLKGILIIGAGINNVTRKNIEDISRAYLPFYPKRLYFGPSVTSIGNDTFQGFVTLLFVRFGDNLKSIGSSAFADCRQLRSVIITEGVTDIGVHSFAYCERLPSVSIPHSVTSIGEGAFRGCGRLRQITISNSVTSIGDYAFAWCKSLPSVIIPNSVTSIGVGAFYGCRDLKYIFTPSGERLEKIPDSTICLPHFFKNQRDLPKEMREKIICFALSLQKKEIPSEMIKMIFFRMYLPDLL